MKKLLYVASIAAVNRRTNIFTHNVAVVKGAQSKQDAREKSLHICLENFPEHDWYNHSASVGEISEFVDQ